MADFPDDPDPHHWLGLIEKILAYRETVPVKDRFWLPVPEPGEVKSTNPILGVAKE
jgi:hypothetical protein